MHRRAKEKRSLQRLLFSFGAGCADWANELYCGPAGVEARFYFRRDMGNPLFRRCILLPRSHKRPNFIALKAAGAEAANVAVVILGGGTAHIAEQVQHGMLGSAGHTAGCGDQNALD